MRRLILSLLFAVVAAACAFAQTTGTMVVRQTDGTEVKFSVSGVDKVYFEDDEPEPTPTTEYVDLGLPSGVKWATCNLGATKPEEYGDYYGWGCTEPYKDTDHVNWTLYFQMLGGSGTDYEDSGTDKDPLKDYVAPNFESIAGTKWDAAHAKLGGMWRMPTHDEQTELLKNCTWEWTTLNGVNGYKVVSKLNGNHIFLPASGYFRNTSVDYVDSIGAYGSSTPSGDAVGNTYFLYLRSDHYDIMNFWRFLGVSVRPVYGEMPKPAPEVEYVDLALPSGLKWAACNLGANAPEEYGDYYGFGCTEPYKDTDDVGWPLYFQMLGGTGASEEDCGTDKDPLWGDGYRSSIEYTKRDAAHLSLGGRWRMPFPYDISELMNPENCEWTWTTLNGVNGYKVVSKRNGNSIFLPAAGCRVGTSLNDAGDIGSYWLPVKGYSIYFLAWSMFFMSNEYDHGPGDVRYWGLTIRPVSE